MSRKEATSPRIKRGEIVPNRLTLAFVEDLCLSIYTNYTPRADSFIDIAISTYTTLEDP